MLTTINIINIIQYGVHTGSSYNCVTAKANKTNNATAKRN